MTLLMKALLMLVAAYAAAAFFVYLQQRNLIYQRSTQQLAPETVGLTNVAVVTVPTPDGERLNAWWSPPVGGKPTVLYLHGNAGTISDRPERFAFYQRHGLGVLFLSWRGYGGSTGNPSEAGLITDALAAHDWLMAQGVAPSSLGVVGESLGSAPAVALATSRPVAALVLEAPFSSMVETASFHYPWLPVPLLLHDRWDSSARIGALQVPLLVIHGTGDTIVPYPLGRKLFDAAPEPKRFITVDNANHLEVFGEPSWQEEVAFFEAVAKPR
jgi:fermentation-respiration switch protein FrsA (DUF1100 family)